MKKAVIAKPFSIVQWHGEEYPYYEEDAEENAFNIGDEVLILHEAKPNEIGRLYVVFNTRNEEACVVSETYLEFVTA